MPKSEVKIRHKFNFIIQEIKDLESENEAIVESKNIHRLKLFQQEVNERKISLNQVINTLLESELDDTQYGDYSKAKKDIFNMLVSIEEALSLIETKENTHSDKQLPESNVNLPKINLPIFNGDSANWLSFREIFNSTINSNQTLTEIQKFQYLNASVKGPAEKLIRGFPISDKNYQQAWDTLCNRFNNRRELAFSQINKIFSIRPLKSISAGSLYEILDVCNEGIRNLSVLGLEKNTLTDLILINFFEKRIGEALRKEWELTLQNEEYPTFENFVNFLEKHARSLQGMRIPLFQEQKTSSKNMMAHGLYVNKGQNCILCHQIHKLNDCHRFINLPLPKKWELVKKHKLCQNCLRANHEISKCLITSRCKNCKQNHHTLLHQYNSEPSISQPTTSQEMLISTNTICNAMPLETETNILLSTALIKVKAKDGSFVLCRALVDNGSQISLISEQCCHKLGLEKRKNSYTLKGVGDIVVNRTTSQVEIEFTPHHNDQLFSARAFVVGRVTADLPNFQIQSADFPHLENLLLADPEFYVTKPIDLILGADTFVEIILGHKTDLKHHPIALNTKLGWLVSGRIHSTIKSNTSVINHCTTELDSSIRKFWELEDVPISKAQLGTKNACEILFKSNIKRDIEGRYSVNLPFKSTPNLGDSRSQALRRFFNLEKRLQANPSLKSQYINFMREYMELNHMELIPLKELKKPSNQCFYLPHHGVLREQSTTTKIRVVFDASSRSTNNLSLNDFLHVGPRLQQNLFNILLRFRTFPIAITADIEKMFRQIRLNSDDRDYHRILWRENPEDPLLEYRLLTVTYGTASAPFLAIRTIQKLAEDESSKFPSASSIVFRDFYVDGCIMSKCLDRTLDTTLVRSRNPDYLKRDNSGLEMNLYSPTQGVLDRLRFYLLKKMDQRTCIKFCVKNEIKCADAFRMLTVAYGEATLDRSNIYRWYEMFSEGQEDVNDEERAGRPSTSTTDEKINQVEKMILANRRITVREVAEELNISIGSCHSIFINDLGMRRVAAKFVPKLLNCDQKQHRMNIANEMLDSVRDDPNLLQRVITGDEAWVYGYDVETKTQSSQWKLLHEPRPKKVCQVRSNVKVLLTVFFDCRGVVHHEFLPQGRTVNKEYYLQVICNLREAICQKRPDLWKNKNWLLHHDNAPAHTSLLVRDFLAKNNTLMMPQPPYSPDLAPCDFFLFPKLKRPMKGRRYAMLDEIKTASKEELKKILKNDRLKCFEDWKKPLAQVVCLKQEANPQETFLESRLITFTQVSTHPIDPHPDGITLVKPLLSSLNLVRRTGQARQEDIWKEKEREPTVSSVKSEPPAASMEHPAGEYGGEEQLAKYPFLINQEKLTTDAFRAVGPHQRGASCTSTTKKLVIKAS
ncbi:hypothetical protein LAZ67_7002112 [Cordylochernes scorpioides]|uniref:Peptidase aspartic putative domain-containing protein n=1 Tax=Cordylochernes scorpioides TaxID=51811 RepID=A0ABY6KPR9_9ARAC|nr:hypothetical protein LAZ67_7002112 [Cordylochernes scorpioides]